jgi:pre-mRNA-splicing helicase BRR2
MIKKKYMDKKDHYSFSFTVPLFEILHPLYYLKVVSDKWIQSETIEAISFKNLVLPGKFQAPTELYDVDPLPIEALEWEKGEKLLKYTGIKYFN